MKNLLLIVLLMFSFNAVADVNTSGLNEEQKAQLALQAAQMKNTSKVTPEVAKEWASVGQAIGVGLVATATELGMGVDQLMTTTTGKLAVSVIIYKVAGKDIIGTIFGLLWLFIIIPVWVYFYRNHGSRQLLTDEQYEKGKREDGKTRLREYRTTSGELKFMYLVSLMLITATGLISIFG